MAQSVTQVKEQAKLFVDSKERIRNYWSVRSHDFAGLRMKELHGEIAQRWLREIVCHLPCDGQLKVLDVGTGSGFFAFLLDDLGHQVTGIDLTPEMIEEARKQAARLDSAARFRVMDAEHLSYVDESFDVIITRNLTWTLPDLAGAYREWFRVLRKGGMLLNFDANYGAEDFAKEEQELPDAHAHRLMERTLLEECNRIKSQLEVSYHARPAWDVQLLAEAGFEKLEMDLGVSARLYPDIDEFYNPTPLFMICAHK